MDALREAIPMVMSAISEPCPVCPAQPGYHCVFQCTPKCCSEQPSYHERLDDHGNMTGEMHYARIGEVRAELAGALAAWDELVAEIEPIIGEKGEMAALYWLLGSRHNALETLLHLVRTARRVL